MRIVLGLCLSFLATGALAQDWALRAGDLQLTKAQLSALANGATVTFYDDGTSRYSAGGAYSYTYAGSGGTAFGRFHVTADGRICVDFRNGFSRCDLFVRSAENGLTLLTENGQRYPVRTETGMDS